MCARLVLNSWHIQIGLILTAILPLPPKGTVRPRLRHFSIKGIILMFSDEEIKDQKGCTVTQLVDGKA